MSAEANMIDRDKRTAKIKAKANRNAIELRSHTIRIKIQLNLDSVRLRFCLNERKKSNVVTLQQDPGDHYEGD